MNASKTNEQNRLAAPAPRGQGAERSRRSTAVQITAAAAHVPITPNAPRAAARAGLAPRLASATAGQTPEAAAALHAEIEPEIYRQAARAREAEAATVSLTDRIARIEAITRRGR